MGLVNGAMGTIKAICYHVGTACLLHDLPVAVTVHFDAYSGPTFLDGSYSSHHTTVVSVAFSSHGGGAQLEPMNN